MISNIDPRKNPWTTGVGGLFLIVFFGLIIYPIFKEVKTDIPKIAYYLTGIPGIVLFFIPDKGFKLLTDFLRKKSNDEEDRPNFTGQDQADASSPPSGD